MIAQRAWSPASWRDIFFFLLVLCCASAQAQNAETPAAQPPELIERGRYLATASDCIACHTSSKDRPYAGGAPIPAGVGTIYSTNITPSKRYGIGAYSRDEFARAVREGVRKDGAHLYPAMPYPAYSKLSDEDIAALYAYFMHGVKPVDVPTPQTRLSFPFKRAAMSAWNLLYADDARFIPNPRKSAQWNRGAYLVEGAAHCGDCHTPRNWLMAEQSDRAFAGAQVGPWYAPNITSDPISGIGGWRDADIVRYLATGNVPGVAQAAGSMAEAIEHSFQYLTQDDLYAIAVYLKTVPPIRDPADRTARHGYGGALSVETGLRGNGSPTDKESRLDRGAMLFSGSCASCHQPDGSGSHDGYYPSLFHNSTTGASNPSNMIATILYGVDRTIGGEAHFMPAFGKGSYVQGLSDAEIADIVTFVFARYGNAKVEVSAQDVAKARGPGPMSVLALIGEYAIPGLIMLVLVLAGLVWWGLRRRQARAA